MAVMLLRGPCSYGHYSSTMHCYAATPFQQLLLYCFAATLPASTYGSWGVNTATARLLPRRTATLCCYTGRSWMAATLRSLCRLYSRLCWLILQHFLKWIALATFSPAFSNHSLNTVYPSIYHTGAFLLCCFCL